MVAPAPLTQNKGVSMRFVVDVMLGRLSKWLRIMGYDTRYETFKPVEAITQLAQTGWIPLTRHFKSAKLLKCAILICDNQVGKQLAQLDGKLHLSAQPQPWFNRCILCNVPLEVASLESVRDNVPEYVFYKNIQKIRFCPACKRHYWPGSHRERMEKQLNLWGFTQPFS